MDFDEHEDEEEEIGTDIPANYRSLGNSGRERMEGVEGASTTERKSGAGGVGVPYKYRECLKNHAVSIGGHAVDGCGEFLPAGEEGTLDALKCAACNCHRNFHRKETEGEGFHHPHHSYHHQLSTYYHRTAPPSGYLHVTPPLHQRPLALPSTSREDEDVSNPSSSGGGGGGNGVGGSKKRFRTRFTPEQKDKMLAFAERLGWRIQKHDEATVQHFCEETNLKRHVLKVWMHNNKHTLGRKP